MIEQRHDGGADRSKLQAIADGERGRRIAFLRIDAEVAATEHDCREVPDI